MEDRTQAVAILLIILIVIGTMVYWSGDYNTNDDDDNITDTTTTNTTNNNHTSANFWVLAYHPVYQWNSLHADDIPWGHLTHLILGYLHVNETSSHEYSLKAPDEFYGDLNSWLDLAHAYIEAGHAAGVKVNCMLGGAGSNPDQIWNRATAPENVKAFAQNIVEVLHPAGFDGLDLDWEDSVEHSQLVSLAKELRGLWSNAIITIPTDSQGLDAAKLAPAKDYVDVFMPMTYASIQQWGGWLIPVPHTPLYGADRPGYGPNPYSVNYTLHKWLDAGVPASQLIMGVGGYGLVWGDSNGDGVAPIAPYSNTDLFGPAFTETRPIAGDNAVTWSWVKSAVENYSGLIEAWDDIGKCTYWHAPATDQLVTVKNVYGQDIAVGIIFYETTCSISAKVSFCDTTGMKGMMFWTLSQMMDGSSCPILEAISW
ncbi:MAG: glycosyl hydrolase family 18 protein [Candidatus Thorarchaeota archaeon]